MEKNRYKAHIRTRPVSLFKVCGPIALGNQKIMKDCLKLAGIYRNDGKLTPQRIVDRIRDDLYKDIENLIVQRQDIALKKHKKLLEYMNNEMQKVVPNTFK